MANDTFLPLGGLLVTIFAAYIWKKANLDKELAIGSGYQGSFLQRYMTVAMKYRLPVVLIIVFITTVLVIFFGM